MIECKFEYGKKVNLRHTTVDALMVKDNKILLTKRSENLSQSGKYCLPGGYLDMNETTSQAVLRELKEETGYEGKVKFLLRINDDPARKNDPQQNINFVYMIEPGEQSGTADSEVTEIKWFNLDKIPNPDNMAFDHYKSIELYKQYIKKNFPLPYIDGINT